MFQLTKDQKKKYLSNRVLDIEALNSAQLEKKFELAIRIGHILKGNGETFGYKEIGNIGKEIEEAGINKKNDTLQLLIDSLTVCVQFEMNKEK